MAIPTFTIDSDLRDYIREFEKATIANNRFRQETVKITAAVRETSKGMKELEISVTGLNKRGEQLALTEKRQAKTQADLLKARKNQTREIKTLSAEEKRRNVAARLNKEAAAQQKKNRETANGFRVTRQLATAEVRAANAARRNARAQRSAGAAIRQQSKLAKDLTITWRSFFRLIALRIAAGAIVRLSGLLREGTTEAIEFSRKIAEVQTIIKSSEQTLQAQQRITQRIIQVSAQNNFDLADTTEAFYDSLSNQVSDSLDGISTFTTSAIRLAKASVSSLEDSANSIVSVVQAFDLSFVQAETIAGKLFNLVDRGRLRLNELANSLGNVAVPAQTAGVSFDELSAVLANLTLKGIAVNRAQTLLRNLFLKMVSPTEKLKQIFREWGVETGRSANETFGLIGVFQKLNVEAEKSATFLGEVFGRIRARLAANASITGDSIEEIIDALGEIQNGAERFNKAVELVRESAGENVQKELRQFKIALFEIIGLNVLKFLDTFDKETADLSDTLAKLALAATAAAIAMAAVAVVLAVVLFASPVGIAAILITIATGILSVSGAFVLLGDSGADAFRKLRKESDIFAAQLREKSIVAIAALDNQLRELNTDVFRSARVLFAEERKELFAIEDLSAKILEEQISKLEAEERYLDLLVNSKGEMRDQNDELIRTNSFLKANLGEQKAIADEALRALQISRQRVTELSKSFEAARFERFIRNASALEQIQARVIRAGGLRQRAINLFNIGNIDEARSAINEAINQLSRADQELFQGTGLNRFERQFRTLENTAFTIEQGFQRFKENMGSAATGEARALTNEIQRNEDALEAQKKLLDDVKDTLSEITRITEDGTLTTAVKNQLIAGQVELLDAILGRENKISEAIQKQVQAKLRLAELAASDRQLKILEEVQADAITAQTEALQEQTANFSTVQSQVIRSSKTLILLQKELNRERTLTAFRFAVSGDKRDLDTIKFIDELLERLNGIIAKAEPLAIKAAVEEPSPRQIRDIKNGFIPLRKELSDFMQSIPVGIQGARFKEVVGEILDDELEIFKVLRVQKDLDQTAIDKKTDLRAVLDGILEVEEDINRQIKEQGTTTKALLDPLNEETNNFRDRVKLIQDESAAAEDRLLAARAAIVLAGQNKELIDEVLENTTDIREEEEAITEELTNQQKLFRASEERTRRFQATKRDIPFNQQGLRDPETGKFLLTREKFEELNEIDLEPIIEQIESVEEANRKAADAGFAVIEAVRDEAEEMRITDEQRILFENGLIQLETQFFKDEFSVRQLIQAIKDLRTELAVPINIPSLGSLGFAAGGFVPKGTDTIPAMLSPGEFVVNAQATLMNRSLLHLINKSSAPVKTQYLQQGGPVTQTNNTTLNLQSVSENIDAKRIGRKIETLQRRGILGARRIYG